MMKFMIYVALVSASMVACQPGGCADVPPTTTFPCDFYVGLGTCDKSNPELYNKDGQLAYCLVTCGLCNEANLAVQAESVDVFEELEKAGGNFAGAEGKAFSVDQFVSEIKSDMTSAITTLTAADLGTGADKQEKVIDAAVATTEVVATAVATAMSSIELRGITNSLNSKAFGLASAQAEAVANATASAYAIAIAEAGDDFTELEASTMENDIQKALTSTVGDFAISGETSATVQQEAYATAVAEVLATATAQAFASLTDTDSQAIALATAQAFNTSQLTCLSFCNNEAPDATMTCQEYVDSNTCSDIVGYCECACGTCSVGSEASVNTFSEIISNSDTEQVLSAMGEAFAEGAKGADAVASAMVNSVTAGNAQAVTTAIAEAFGAQEISGIAIVEALTQAINMGGDEMTIAVADAFALAESGGFVDAFAQAIADAFSLTDSGKAKAMTSAISAAIANGNCEAMSVALSEAAALASGQGTGDAFAASLSQSESINDCFYASEDIPSVYSIGDSYVAADSEAANIDSEKVIVDYLTEKDISASVIAITDALSKQRTAAVTDAFAHAIGNGVPSGIIVDVIAKVIASSGKIAIDAFVEAFAAAEIGHSDALSAVFLEGILGNGGASSEYIVDVITEGVAKYECSVFAQSLTLAHITATDSGFGTAFADALSSVVSACLKVDFSLADSVKDALLKGDMLTVQEMTIQASGEVDGTAAFVEGLSVAKQMGVDCDIIKSAISLGQELSGFKSELAKADSVYQCVSSGYSQCRGLVNQKCCSNGYPAECGCTRMRCRTSKNVDASMPLLGLHVYTDVGNRHCECPIVA
eukprot:TRINITY_DN676_c0_g1_i1.p1 TRINITY_DN676_c0_g1~~TRINITY_DN676_c0_g1_i1.p1  ORF type:complete len:896 (-),score=250.73 TRINITY_DN676_c0_g1_i1:266-2731(-)